MENEGMKGADISVLVTQDNAERGVWTQVELYGKKQPFDACILGADCDAVVLEERERERKAQSMLGTLLGRTAAGPEDTETAEDIREDEIRRAVIRLAGLRSRDGGPLVLQGVELKSDMESYRLICRKVPAFRLFVLKFSGERMNFLSGTSAG